VAITIRPVRTHAEYRAVEEVQRQAWGLVETEIVPDHLLVTVHKNGGFVLGAFESGPEGEHMVGFVLGFPGLTTDGRVKHCSHMAGVVPCHQNRNIGYQLKLAQRQYVLEQGLDLITWTFDPLESRNARLNFRKLGAVCRTYLRDFYGAMRDTLNVGVATDRFQVEWHIASAYVTPRLSEAYVGPHLTGLLAEGVRLINPPLAGDPQQPAEQVLPFNGEHLLVQIPASFQDVKAADMGLARAWREHTRTIFETAFAQGYTVVDLLFENGQSYYLLTRIWSPPH
jgi:predicted GNAT superfamily acetyltransferase